MRDRTVFPEPLEGRDANRKDLEDFLRAFSDLRAVVRSVIAGGGSFASEGIGPAQGMRSFPLDVALFGHASDYEEGP